MFSAHQRSVVDAFLDEVCAQRSHVVIALSGAHAYGFPSPDSDIDLKAVHMAPTQRVLGFHPPDASVDRLTIVEGVELDYTSNELGPVLSGVLKGNGNYIERFLGCAALRSSPWLAPLQPLIRANLNQRVVHHYRGFATSQRKEAERKPIAKKVLYVLRTTLTGVHLLRTGEVEMDLRVLYPRYDFGEAEALIARKLAGEQSPLPDLDRWNGVMDRAFATLEDAWQRSILPPEPAAAAALEDWLVQARIAALEQP